MVYDTCNSSIHRAYKPTFTSLGGPHLVSFASFLQAERGPTPQKQGEPPQKPLVDQHFPVFVIIIIILIIH